MSFCWQNACQMHKMAVRLSAVAGIWVSCYMYGDTDRDIFQISGYSSIHRNVKCRHLKATP